MHAVGSEFNEWLGWDDNAKRRFDNDNSWVEGKVKQEELTDAAGQDRRVWRVQKTSRGYYE